MHDDHLAPREMPSVTVVIPAHNEEQRIGRVLESVLAADFVSRVVVVNDGSADQTSSVARRYHNVHVHDLPSNCGKGGAMLTGAKLAEGSDVLLFLDGDLINLTPAHVCALVGPVVRGEADMAVGQFRGGRGLTDLAQKLVPYISGQRAIRRDLFLQIPDLDRVGYGIEMAITFYVKHFGRNVTTVMMRGVTHPMKEEKLGFVRGAWARARMYKQMAAFWIKYRSNPPSQPLRGAESNATAVKFAPKVTFRASGRSMASVQKEHKAVVRNGRSK